MKSIHLAAVAAFCLLTSCGPEPEPKTSNVTIEAADYAPIGEGAKYFSLSILGAAVVLGIASMVNNGGGDHD